MKVRKVIWWLVVILLFLGAIVFIVYAHQMGSTQFLFLEQLSKSIDRNHAAWEKIDIEGMDARLFHKNLWIFSKMTLGLATDSAVLFGILSLFLFITLQYEKRKNKKLTANDKT
jgi:hypothetical protein